MKATMRSGRTGTAVHNEHLHINEEDRDVEIFDATHSSASTLRNRELMVYSKEFRAGIEERNSRYLAQRHPERVRTLEQVYTNKRTRPEECIVQVGNMIETIHRNLFCELVRKLCMRLQKWNREHGYPFRLLDVAYHFDEATPHAHIRRVWKYTDDRGYVRIGQEEALRRAGVELPYPDKPVGRYNNRKISFDKMAREMWYEICREHGLDIDTKPLPSRRHLSTKEYTQEQIRAKEARMNELCTAVESLESALESRLALTAEAERKASAAREEAEQARKEAESARFRSVREQENTDRCRREAHLAAEMLRDINSDIELSRRKLKAIQNQVDHDLKGDVNGILKGIAARQELDAIREDHPELFDEKGQYRKKAGRSERGDGYKDIFHP